MPNELLEEMKKAIINGEKQLKEVKELIAKLKTAGEDTIALERQYRVVKSRVDRYKKAFG